MTVSIESLSKTYGGAKVLDGVDLEVEAGQVHALLGANGAGKSTLIKCASGAVQPSSGSITIAGVRHRSLTPREALEAGVAVIYQQFSLIPPLSVAENVFLGSELRRRRLLFDRRRQLAATGELLERLGARISPEARVRDLPVADQQLVEVAKAIHHRAKLLILDEPTASLSETERAALMDQVRALKAEGLHILYVTHLLDEVFEIADHVTVLRDGTKTFSAPVSAVGHDDLVRAISGGLGVTATAESTARTGHELLAADELESDRLGPLSLRVDVGEIVGVFGLLGSGRTELVETLFGARRRYRGRVTLDGRAFAPKGPPDAVRRGVALVPAERLRQSMFPTLSALDNVLLTSFGGLATRGLRSRRAERRHFERIADRLGLRPPEPRAAAWTFSGGNQQKLAVGRWLGRGEGVRLLMLDDPTQGIDVGARSELYNLLREVVSGGERAVLFTSSSPEEVVTLADRALVLQDGHVAGELRAPDISEDRLLSLAHALEEAA
jgi:ribose transport system ATP-binding protein